MNSIFIIIGFWNINILLLFIFYMELSNKNLKNHKNKLINLVGNAICAYGR